LKQEKIYDTKSVCPECNKLLKAVVFHEDKKVFMKKRCSAHGTFKVLLDSDYGRYRSLGDFSTPGLSPKSRENSCCSFSGGSCCVSPSSSDAKSSKKGCPYDCGLCDEHQQHTCTAMIDVCDFCQIQCPVCYADTKGKTYLSKEEFSSYLDRVMKAEGGCRMVQLLGGEPTLHPHLLDLINIAEAKGVEVIVINTNGLVLSESENLARDLSGRKVMVNLQFDGLDDKINESLRGIKMLDSKMKAIDNLNRFKVPCSLVVTVKEGLNDDQYNQIIGLCLKKGIRDITITPLGYVGRASKISCDPSKRYTVSDVIADIEKQTGGKLRKDDFLPFACPHTSCITWSMLIKDKESYIPITQLVNISDYKDLISNRVIDGSHQPLRKTARLFFNASRKLGFRRVFKDFWSIYKTIGMKGFLHLNKKGVRICIHNIMDVYTFDTVRLKKCCIHFIDKGGFVPFCAKNVIYRGSAAILKESEKGY